MLDGCYAISQDVTSKFWELPFGYSIMSNGRQSNLLKKIEPLLEKYGVIMESDQHLPSVVSAIVEKPIHGSWWGHPQGDMIYQALGILSQRPDVLITKLLSRKTTFVHRRLWPEFLTIATSREPWQLDHLSPNAQQLLSAVQRKESCQQTSIRKNLVRKLVSLEKGPANSNPES